MSTEAPTTRRGRRAKAARGRFAVAFAVTLAALVLVGGVGAAVSLGQGPRASSVAIDTEAVAEVAGQRLVFTANQPLAGVEADQVSVSPAAPFTVVASGRNVAVQFTYALDPDTEYSVAIDGVEGAAGGPASTLEHSFRTGAPGIQLLQRREGDDAVFASNIAGDEAVPIFTAPQIEDFRAARDGLVVLTTEDTGVAALTAVDPATGDAQPFVLPGEGTIAGLQAADHGGLVGYTFTSSDIGAEGALETSLFIASLDDPGAEPERIAVGEDPRVQQWAFVPQTSYLLVLSFDGQLRLVDTADLAADPVPLGTALAIAGVEQGTGLATVTRLEGDVVIDLTTLDEQPLVEPDGVEDLGIAGPLTPTVSGATLRLFTVMGEDGYPLSQNIVQVSSTGEVEPLLQLDDRGDAVMQVCGSPSGRYAAVVVAPDLVDNPYDLYLRPLPTNLQTLIVDTADGSTVSTLQGSDVTWCAWAM